MGKQLEFSPDSLDKKGHFLVETLNKFVSQLPEREAKVGQRLAIQILEVADLASQETISSAAGLAQSRSLRYYKKRLREEGLAALFDRQRTGRPSVTNQPLLQKRLSDIIWQALLTERILPDDTTLATRLRSALESDSFDHTRISPGIVKTIRLRLGFCRSKIQLLLSTSTLSPTSPKLPALLPLSDHTPTSPNNTQIPTLPLPDQDRPASSNTPSIEASQQVQPLATSVSDQLQIPATYELYNAHIPSELASHHAFTPNNTQIPLSHAYNNAHSDHDCAQHNAPSAVPNHSQVPASHNPNAIIAVPFTPPRTQTAIESVYADAQLPISGPNQAQANLVQKEPALASLTVTSLALLAESLPSNTTFDATLPPVLLDHSSLNEQNQPMIDTCSAYFSQVTCLSEGSVLPIAHPSQQQAKSANSESVAPSSCAVDKDLQEVSTQSNKSKSALQNEQAGQKRYVAKSSSKETEQATEIGITNVGGAFILLALLVQTSWLACASILPIPSNYAVTTTQWLLTAIFSVIFGIKRAFHLDDCLDIGFAVVTGRARPLSHSTFQHILRSFDDKSVEEFYKATAKEEVEQLEEGTHRISVDGHNLARYTQVVDLQKGKIGNSGRILPAEEMVLAFSLDKYSWLAMRAYHGTNKLSTALPDIIQELRQNKPHDKFRIFVDKGAYHGKSFQKLKDVKNVHFYIPAKRTNPNVKQWEAISDEQYTSFVFDKHMKLAKDKRPTYRMADTKMQINVYQDKKKVGTVCLRALVVNNPDGQKPAEVWPFVLLTDDENSDAKKLINEYGDHWALLIGHRVGRHDLFLDVLPTGYKIKSKRNESGEIEREVEFDQSAFRLSAWLRLLVYNLIGRFASQLPANYQKMWAGTLLRKFIRRQATIYLLEEELLIVFDPFPDHEALHPLMVELNAKRIPIPWLNNLVLQFAIANKPMYPLKDPEKRKRLFSRH